MFFYRVGYWSYDGSAGVELCHAERFEQDAFEALVHAATADVLREERRDKAHFPFAWIYDQVAQRLVMRHGFQRVEYAADYEIFGSGSVLEGDPDMPDLDRLYRYLRDQGLAP